MATQTKPAQQRQQTPQLEAGTGQVAIIAPPRMLPPAPEVLKQYDVTTDGWRTLVEAIFPAAKTPASVIMALEYCARRKLDIFKHPVHIVPIWNSQANEGRGGYVETVWPGIAELRTTAARTKEYAGMDAPTFGPVRKETFAGKVKKWKNRDAYWEDESATVEFPEWCQITVYRLMGGNRVPFPGPRVLWLETYACKGNTEIPNEMWQKRPHGQLEKCAEAAALRRAFPEELGNDYAIDEIGAFHTHEARDVTGEASVTINDAPPEPQRSDPRQSNSAATPPAADAQPEDDAPREAGGGIKPGPAAGHAASAATDVQDLNATPDKSDLSEDEASAPPLFETYTRIGDFFAFADPWLQDPIRMEAELVAFGVFYNDYMRERLSPDFKNARVREAMQDTKRLWDEALQRASQTKG